MTVETESKNKRRLRFVKRLLIGIVIALAVIFIGVIAAFKIYTSNYYRADSAILSAIENLLDDQVHSYSDKNGAVFLPQQKEAKAIIVFYPGGKVEYNAYAPLMYEICARGYICLLPKMPENLAVLRVDAADVLVSGYDDDISRVKELDWYLAGHSLGGVAASQYLKTNLDDKANANADRNYSGIIFCASYTTEDFSDTDLRLLSIFASNDGVISKEGYEESKKYWPADSEEKIIDGGIHSYFGCYGIQSGDGTPTITNEEQIIKTADYIESFIEAGE
jgi:hypothetical protein